MPDLDELRGNLQGTGGVILDGMVKVAEVGTWVHHRYEPKGSAPYWTTDIEGVSIPRGTYRLKLTMDTYLVEMRRAYWNGERFTGPGAAEVRKAEGAA